MTYGNRGVAWTKKKDYDKAVADFTEAMRLDPKNPSFHSLRGFASYFTREYDQAIADFTETIRKFPPRTDIVHARGIIWYLKGEYAKALDDYNEAIRIEPESPIAYDSCAWICATCPQAKHRDGKKAIESATKACELTRWNVARLPRNPCGGLRGGGRFRLGGEMANEG